MLTTAPPDHLHTVTEIADTFHVHTQTVRLWWRTGQLGHIKVGRYRYSTDDQLAAFIDAHRIDVA